MTRPRFKVFVSHSPLYKGWWAVRVDVDGDSTLSCELFQTHTEALEVALRWAKIEADLRLLEAVQTLAECGYAYSAAYLSIVRQPREYVRTHTSHTPPFTNALAILEGRTS